MYTKAYFTANERYIFMRIKDGNIMKVFVYDVQNKKIMHTLKEHIFIKNGCFDEKKNYIFISFNIRKQGYYII